MLLACGTGLAVWACATPAWRADRQATALGLTREVVRGAGFDHAVYHRGLDQGRGPVHVYLEGDGSPAAALRWWPPDPTPRDLVALRLMALDPAPSVYLGRPCQHAVGPCEALWWSTGRFGEPVIASLVSALRRLELPEEAPELVLIGFSGGGALAMLMAERMPEVTAVVTLAGNLDVGAWSQHHGFEPLAQSLDPARAAPLDARVVQLHLLAGRDRRVPPGLVQDFLARQHAPLTRLYAGFDHACCWEEVWPHSLRELSALLAAAHRSAPQAGPLRIPNAPPP